MKAQNEIPILYRDISYVSPYNWSSFRKQWICWPGFIAACFASYAAGSYSPGAGQMVDYWKISRIAVLTGITSFTCGFGLAPMILAPLSELHGRKPVFIATGILFVVCQVCSAVTRSFPGMIVARFFAGAGSSTYSTMVGGLIADLYRSEDINTPMALFSGTALFGVGLGPLISGFIAEYSSWRWIFYSQAIANALLVTFFILFVPETRESVLARQKVAIANKLWEEKEQKGLFYEKPGADGSTEKWRLRWKADGSEKPTSIRDMIVKSLFRPFRLLFTEPVVFFFSLWAAFAWAVLYIALAAVPLIFQDVYGFSLSRANAVFASMSIGAVMGTVMSIAQDKIARRYKLLPDSPESRLYFTCFESLLLPAGLFMFGWASRVDVHWIVPAIAIGIATVGIFCVYLSVFNYLADVYGIYASSAIAAQSFCRNVVGGIFPLVTTQLFTNLGYGPAGSLLGAIGLLLSVVPWVLVFYGKTIRSKSKFALDI